MKMARCPFLGFCGAVFFGVIAVSGCSTFPQSSSGRIGMEAPGVSVDIAFNSEDRRRITNYYKVKSANLPPGLARKNQLPPGLQKQLSRNGKLPPGLERSPLPMVLEQQLEFLPAGYVRLKVGMDVVLVQEDTEIIIDIIHEVGK